jgi:hypothetical protein
MNSRLIYGTFWLVFAIWNFYDWRKNKDKDLLWFMGIGVVGFSAELIYYYLIAVNTQPSTLSIVGSFVKVFDIVGIASFIYILIKNLGRKR